MGLYDTVTVDVLAADFQTKQLGEDMLRYRLGEDGRLVAPCGALVPITAWSTSTARTAPSSSPCSPTGASNSWTPSPKRWATPTVAWDGASCGCGTRGDLTAQPARPPSGPASEQARRRAPLLSEPNTAPIRDLAGPRLARRRAAPHPRTLSSL